MLNNNTFITTPNYYYNVANHLHSLSDTHRCCWHYTQEKFRDQQYLFYHRNSKSRRSPVIPFFKLFKEGLCLLIRKNAWTSSICQNYTKIWFKNVFYTLSFILPRRSEIWSVSGRLPDNPGELAFSLVMRRPYWIWHKLCTFGMKCVSNLRVCVYWQKVQFLLYYCQ